MLSNIQQELSRLDASNIDVTVDGEFEPEAGRLARIEIAKAYWHMPPQDFLTLLMALPDGAGSDAVHQAIEREAPAVWHGPAPKASRDTML